MGKGRRVRKQMVSVEEDDLSGSEDVSSDGDDDIYEPEFTDNETVPAGSAAVRRSYRKRARETTEELPLMEVDGKSFRVLGFNQCQRAAFVESLMRFGMGEGECVKRTAGLEKKTRDEIENYGMLFMSHLMEDLTEDATFSDGVPKEGLIATDVFVRIGTLSLFREKVKALSDKDCSTLFTDDIKLQYPELRGGRIWKEHHDLLLLRAVLKHGYERWEAIVDDKDIKIQEVICQELNLPDINAPATQTQSHPSGIPFVHTSASGTFQPHLHASGENPENAEAPAHQAKVVSVGGNDHGDDVSRGATDSAVHNQLFQDQSLYHLRELQRIQVEFIKERVLLLEKGLLKEKQHILYAF